MRPAFSPGAVPEGNSETGGNLAERSLGEIGVQSEQSVNQLDMKSVLSRLN